MTKYNNKMSRVLHCDKTRRAFENTKEIEKIIAAVEGFLRLLTNQRPVRPLAGSFLCYKVI